MKYMKIDHILILTLEVELHQSFLNELTRRGLVTFHYLLLKSFEVNGSSAQSDAAVLINSST